MNMIVEIAGGLSAVLAAMARIWRSMRRVVALAASKRGASFSASCSSSAAFVYSSKSLGTCSRAEGAIN